MTVCSTEVIKNIGKFLNTSVGPICFSSDKILNTVINKQNVEGFASIILKLNSISGQPLTEEQRLLCYQWLEHITLYVDQAATNPTFARGFLQDINNALQRSTYLTGNHMTVADVALFHVLYQIMERLSLQEKESLIHLSRWFKHVQSQPKVCTTKPTLQMNTLMLSVLAPVASH